MNHLCLALLRYVSITAYLNDIFVSSASSCLYLLVLAQSDFWDFYYFLNFNYYFCGCGHRSACDGVREHCGVRPLHLPFQQAMGPAQTCCPACTAGPELQSHLSGPWKLYF